MNALLAALQFLTVIPVTARLDERSLERAPAWFPAVGLLLGTLAALGTWGLEGIGVSGPLLAILSVALLAAGSGGLHLDGLADTADGFLSARPRERVLEIMRDSRIGTMGVLALFLVLAIKVAALGELSHELQWRALLLAPLSGRTSILLMMRCLPYARDPSGGLATVFCRRRSPAALAAAIASTVVASMMTLGVSGGFACLLATGLGVGFMATWSWQRIGGFTGDTLGATSEIVEAAVLLTVCTCGNLGSRTA